MENTLENKAKFFAQYWGVEAVRYDEYTKPMAVDFVDFIEMKESIFLELKPLSSITDEYAAEVDRIYYDFVNHDGNSLIGKNLLSSTHDLSRLPTHISDYIRSLGYALPWMGLSVETMIEYGWIKLKEN